jgi:hypothetical protein
MCSCSDGVLSTHQNTPTIHRSVPPVCHRAQFTTRNQEKSESSASNTLKQSQTTSARVSLSRCHALGVGEDDGLRWTILTFHLSLAQLSTAQHGSARLNTAQHGSRLFQRLEELIKLVAVAQVPERSTSRHALTMLHDSAHMWNTLQIARKSSSALTL